VDASRKVCCRRSEDREWTLVDVFLSSFQVFNTPLNYLLYFYWLVFITRLKLYALAVIERIVKWQCLAFSLEYVEIRYSPTSKFHVAQLVMKVNISSVWVGLYPALRLWLGQMLIVLFILNLCSFAGE
jgi:hypothetical protein